jgi:hypothetical protein
VLKSHFGSRIVLLLYFCLFFAFFLTQISVVHPLSPFTRLHSSQSLTTIYAAQIPNNASLGHSLVQEVKVTTPSLCVPRSRCCIQRQVNRSPSIWTIIARCSTSLNVSTRKNLSLAGALFLSGIPLVLAEKINKYLAYCGLRYSTGLNLNTYSALIQNFYSQETAPYPAIHITLNTGTELGEEAGVKAYVR